MKKIQKTIQGRRVALWTCEEKNAPLIILIAHHQLAGSVQKVCRKTNPDQPFHMLSFIDLNWDQDLSLWPHAPIVQKTDQFSGGADQFLEIVEESIEWSKTMIGKSPYTIVAGYSMGGLFALYTSYQSTLFDAIVCASGSVWYPDFYEYATTHSMKGQPRSIYLSLGKKETNTRNPYLQQTADIMEKLEAFYQALRIPCIFEWNPGNHFVDGDLRLAKGILWSFQEMDKNKSENKQIKLNK